MSSLLYIELMNITHFKRKTFNIIWKYCSESGFF